MRSIVVDAKSRRYPIFLGYGLLERTGALLGCSQVSRRLYVVSSPRVWRCWGRALSRGLRRGGIRVELLLMDDREQRKSLAAVERLARGLLRRGADRAALLAAVGGGVVGDVVGFLAASYMRGVDYVQVPTTLVAQIDSAIGGKTGVNLREGKNLLGAFHHPCAVLVDPRTLATLPEREFNAGLYELIKYAIIGDAALFAFLERHLEAVKKRQPRTLQYVLYRAIRQKARVVAQDEREGNQRRILNFGHTFGHALEALSSYRRFRHGEAVGWGMLMATRLAHRLGRAGPAEVGRIVKLVRRVGSLPPLPRVSLERLLAQLRADKKRRGDALFFVLPERIGRVTVTADVPRAALRRTVEEFLGPGSSP